MAGTGSFAEIRTDGSLQRNPITNAGRAAVNAYKDDDEIELRRVRIQQKRNLYPGPVQDVNVSIYPGELVFARHAAAGSILTRKKGSELFVMSSLNGAFDLDKGLSGAYKGLYVVGVAGAQGARHDHTNNNPERDLPVIVGGLVTIQNTGPKRIANGDYVYWRLPDPTLAGKYSGHSSHRVLMELHPYDSGLDYSFRRHVAEKIVSGAASVGAEFDHHTADAADAIRTGFIVPSVLLTFHTLLATGAMSATDVSRLAKAIKSAPATSYGSVDKLAEVRRIKETQALALDELAEAIGVKQGRHGITIDTKTPFLSQYLPSIVGQGKVMTDQAPAAMQLIGVMSYLKTAQGSAIEVLFRSINSMADLIRARIVGRANTAALPRAEFDMQLSHMTL